MANRKDLLKKLGTLGGKDNLDVPAAAGAKASLVDVAKGGLAPDGSNMFNSIALVHGDKGYAKTLAEKYGKMKLAGSKFSEEEAAADKARKAAKDRVA